MAIAGYNSQFLLSSTPSVATTNEATTTTDLTTYTLASLATNPHRYFDPKVAVVVQTSPDGTTWTTVTSGFTLYRCNARVVFAVAQAAGTQVRFASANYLPYATLGNAASCEFAGKMDTVESTVFNSTGAHTYVPTLLSGTMKASTWWLNNAIVALCVARSFLIVSFITSTGNRYEGFCYLSDTNIKTDTKSLVGQDLTFQLTDEFFNS